MASIFFPDGTLARQVVGFQAENDKKQWIMPRISSSSFFMEEEVCLIMRFLYARWNKKSPYRISDNILKLLLLQISVFR
jgi:hypothetical protein